MVELSQSLALVAARLNEDARDKKVHEGMLRNVDVIRGTVEVHSLLRDGQRWIISKGMRGHFDTAGNGRLEKIITEEG